MKNAFLKILRLYKTFGDGPDPWIEGDQMLMGAKPIS
jgi:hypothetical protein